MKPNMPKARIGTNADGSFCIYFDDLNDGKPIGKYARRDRAIKVAERNGYVVTNREENS